MPNFDKRNTTSVSSHAHCARGIKGLCGKRRVENIVMEYSPGVYDATNRWDDYPDWPRMLI